MAKHKRHLLEAVGLLDRRSDLIDPGHGDELGQLEGRLLYPSLPLQVLALLAPVSWHRHGVAVGLEQARCRTRGGARMSNTCSVL